MLSLNHRPKPKIITRLCNNDYQLDMSLNDCA